MFASPIDTPSVIVGTLYSRLSRKRKILLTVQELLKCASAAGEVVQSVKREKGWRDGVLMKSQLSGGETDPGASQPAQPNV